MCCDSHKLFKETDCCCNNHRLFSKAQRRCHNIKLQAISQTLKVKPRPETTFSAYLQVRLYAKRVASGSGAGVGGGRCWGGRGVVLRGEGGAALVEHEGRAMWVESWHFTLKHRTNEHRVDEQCRGMGPRQA